MSSSDPSASFVVPHSDLNAVADHCGETLLDSSILHSDEALFGFIEPCSDHHFGYSPEVSVPSSMDRAYTAFPGSWTSYPLKAHSIAIPYVDASHDSDFLRLGTLTI
jgi:hypothetical protein